MKLYRAVSEKEKNDYDNFGEFRTSKNTLEAKQFFKSRTAVLSFVKRSVVQEYDPSYKYLLIIDVDEDYLQNSNVSHLSLDGFDAVSIEENGLLNFSFYINFVREENL